MALDNGQFTLEIPGLYRDLHRSGIYGLQYSGEKHQDDNACIIRPKSVCVRAHKWSLYMVNKTYGVAVYTMNHRQCCG